MLLARVKEFAARLTVSMQIAQSGRLDPSVLDPAETTIQRHTTVGEAFFELVEKYGLTGKVDLSLQTYGGHHFRLIAILPDANHKWITARIVKTGTAVFFPPGFVKEVRDLIDRYQTALRKTYGEWQKVTFEIHPTGMTLQEIKDKQAAWAVRCEDMNAR